MSTTAATATATEESHTGGAKSATTNNAVIQTRSRGTAVVRKFIIPVFMTAVETHNVEKEAEAAICFPVVSHRDRRSLRASRVIIRVITIRRSLSERD